MHPEILRELTLQRGREMRRRAHEATLARAVSRARRGRRRAGSMPDDTDGFAIPAIPDYVDGSFGVSSADDQAASRPGRPGRVPAARRAG